MTDKQLRKLNRAELLELLLEQSREIDRLQEELTETREALQERNLKIESCGSIAEAASEVNSLFHAAQRAADMYLLNVQRICAEKAEEAGKAEEWEEALRVMQPGAPESSKETVQAGSPADSKEPDQSEGPEHTEEEKRLG